MKKGLFSKFKDYNYILDKILEEKNFSEDSTNLLLNMIYKIEVSYKDYAQIKGIFQKQNEFIDEILFALARYHRAGGCHHFIRPGIRPRLRFQFKQPHVKGFLRCLVSCRANAAQVIIIAQPLEKPDFAHIHAVLLQQLGKFINAA